MIVKVFTNEKKFGAAPHVAFERGGLVLHKIGYSDPSIKVDLVEGVRCHKNRIFGRGQIMVTVLTQP